MNHFLVKYYLKQEVDSTYATTSSRTHTNYAENNLKYTNNIHNLFINIMLTYTHTLIIYSHFSFIWSLTERSRSFNRNCYKICCNVINPSHWQLLPKGHTLGKHCFGLYIRESPCNKEIVTFTLSFVSNTFSLLSNSLPLSLQHVISTSSRNQRKNTRCFWQEQRQRPPNQ